MLSSLNLHAAPYRYPPDKFQIKVRARKRKRCKSRASKLAANAPWENATAAGVEEARKMFRQNWRRLSAIWQPLSHVDLIFHFHKYFSSVAKKYLFEVKQILLTDLFVSHLVPFEFDMVTPLQRARRINYETGWNKRPAVACRWSSRKTGWAGFKRRCAAFPLNLHPVRQINKVGCLITRDALSQEATLSLADST